MTTPDQSDHADPTDPTDPRTLHAQATDLFTRLRALHPDARTEALAGVTDPALRDEVASLLRYDEPDAHPAADADPESDPFAEGVRFGPYTVLRRLGRGATGVVLLAEQTEPVRRRVAVKVVPQAMLDAQHAARFDFERRALERTEHPGIPAVLDAGRTPHGMPYIVMEFVDGPPITEYARTHALALPARIDLIVQAAGAIQHAHQRGLIHRDLKPANILVADHAGAPRPKVVDFGIARAVDRDGAHSLTVGQPIGTLAYMPPEQTGAGVVDTRADVYALGAVLYELVAGRPPVEITDPARAAEQIRTAVPSPPSRAAPGALPPNDRAPRTMLADLDRVLACALEKNPARRYATADAFADDLRRVLRREPVAARTQTPIYRAARLIERRKGPALATGVAALALVLGVAGMGFGYAEAQRQRTIADARAGSLSAMNRFLVDDLLAAITPHEIAIDTPAVTLLDRAGAQIDRRFHDRPTIAAELHHTLGRAYTQLAAYDAAETHLTRAQELATETTGPDAPAAVRARLALTSLLASRQRFDDAAAAYDTLLPLARAVLTPDDPALHAAFNDAGIAYDAAGRSDLGTELLEESLDARRRTLGPEDPLVLLTLNNLAQVHDAAGRTEDALALLLEAARVADAMPDPPRVLRIGLHNNIGATYLDLGRDADAGPHLTAASDLAADWLGPDDPTTLVLLGNLASLRARLGDADGAADAFDRIVLAHTARLGPVAPDTLSARHGLHTARLAQGRADDAAAGFAELVRDCHAALGNAHWLTPAAHISYAHALEALGRTGEAHAHAATGADLFRQVLGPDHPRTTTARDMAARLAP